MKKFLIFCFAFGIVFIIACNKIDKTAEENKLAKIDEEIIVSDDEAFYEVDEEDSVEYIVKDNDDSSSPELPSAKKISDEEQFISAINNLEIQQIKDLIKKGININFTKEERQWISGLGPAVDAYKLVPKKPLDYAVQKEKNIKENIEGLKKRLEEEKADALLSKEEWQAKYGDCIVCEAPNPEQYAKELQEVQEKEKVIAEIIKLLKAAGAK